MLYYFRTMTGEMLGIVSKDIENYSGLTDMTNVCVLVPTQQGMNISLLMGEETISGFRVKVNLDLVLVCHKVDSKHNLWAMYQKALQSSPKSKMVT